MSSVLDAAALRVPAPLPADLPATLARLRRELSDDFAAVDRLLAPHLAARDSVGRGLQSLAAHPGKRLRPLCLLLAARLGEAPPGPRRALAAAVELVHNATLLHDDLIDGSGERRGQPATHAEAGPAVAVLGGDRLLVAGLGLASAGGLPEVSASLFAVVQEMIDAEAFQLQWREAPTGDWQAACLSSAGKSAGLFRWALWAGGRVAGLADGSCRALATLGHSLGLAYQATDDLEDLLAGGATAAEELSVPNLVLVQALERQPRLERQLKTFLLHPGEATPERVDRLLAAVRATGACEEVRRFAGGLLVEARAALESIPGGDGLPHLTGLVHALARRLGQILAAIEEGG